jgi:hypothetical protein
LDWGRGHLGFGYFDLEQPGAAVPGDAPARAEPLPALPPGEHEARLRLRGVGQMDLCVVIDGESYGPYPLVCTAEDPEDVLQG